MTEERKATDILLSLERDVQELLKHHKNYDFHNRIIMERLKIITDQLNNHKASPPTLPVMQTAIPSAVLSPPIPPAVSSPPTVKESPFKDPDIKEKIRKAMAEAKSDIGNNTDTTKPVSVCQKIIGSDNKNIFMAKVDIFNSETSELVKSTKTNQTGKWLTQLAPGVYDVQITKPATQNKSQIKEDYKIVVPADYITPIIELDLKKVG